jgi:hypothetical protein
MEEKAAEVKKQTDTNNARAYGCQVSNKFTTFKEETSHRKSLLVFKKVAIPA